ncbi:MAG: EAL domain-containing protein [Proteobacteria bacterium]|nr:EAL domain-containing protein [Pseudomonadota bacterium]
MAEVTSEEIFIGRQPIMDRHQQLYAYELLFRSSQQKNSAEVLDNLAATANVIMHAFADLGIEDALGAYKGFINCDESLLVSDMLEALPSEKIVLEVLETVEVTPTIVERCTELKARGFTIALDDFIKYEDKYKPLLDIVEIVKVDILPLNQTELNEATRALKQWPLMLLAEKVDSQEQAAYCHKLGYDLFQGYYFAKPTIIAGKKLNLSQMALLQLLGLVLADGEVPEMEKVLKREPGLTMNLLRLTNSVATGVRTKVTSMRHAIQVLGMRQLQRWLQLLLYTNPAGGNNSVASPLLQLAATRGRLMELMAGKLRHGDRAFEDHAFMTGIMSLMPTLMGIPMEKILSTVNFGNDVREALESYSGTLGTMLSLTEALEGNDIQLCHDLTEKLSGIDAGVVNACLTQALTWANNIGKENA